MNRNLFGVVILLVIIVSAFSCSSRSGQREVAIQIVNPSQIHNSVVEVIQTSVSTNGNVFGVTVYNYKDSTFKKVYMYNYHYQHISLGDSLK